MIPIFILKYYEDLEEKIKNKHLRFKIVQGEKVNFKAAAEAKEKIKYVLETFFKTFFASQDDFFFFVNLLITFFCSIQKSASELKKNFGFGRVWRLLLKGTVAREFF